MASNETNCAQGGEPLEPSATEAASSPQCGGPAVPPAPVGTSRTSTRRLARVAIVGGLCVLVIGIATAVSYPIIRDELERARVATGPVGAQGRRNNAKARGVDWSESEPDDPSERCELRVYRDQPGGETIVVLTPPGKMTEFGPNENRDRSRFVNEMVRQAVSWPCAMA